MGAGAPRYRCRDLCGRYSPINARSWSGTAASAKSTLVNALLPAAERATGVVNAVTGRGRHTSTSAVMLALPGGGSIIDTPGVRSFGLHHVDPDTVVGAFGDLAVGLDDCPRGCSHDEPDCGLDAFVSGRRRPSTTARAAAAHPAHTRRGPGGLGVARQATAAAGSPHLPARRTVSP